MMDFNAVTHLITALRQTI